MGRGDLPARTHVTVERRFGQRALLSLRPIEGRQHQLRAHLYLAGTPIVGDKLYQAGDAYFARWSADPMGTSDREPLATPFHCLHAWQLTLPVDGEDQTFIAPLPEHFLLRCHRFLMDRRKAFARVPMKMHGLLCDRDALTPVVLAFSLGRTSAHLRARDADGWQVACIACFPLF